MGYGGSSAVLLSPLHAGVLAGAGHDRRSVATGIHEAAVIPAEVIRRRHGRVRGRPDRLSGDRVHALSDPDHLLLAVVGGPGAYSAVFCGLADGVGSAVTVMC
jgi:hypothetical protein